MEAINVILLYRPFISSGGEGILSLIVPGRACTFYGQVKQLESHKICLHLGKW